MNTTVPAPDAERLEVPTRVSHVTVLEDRALIRRTGRLELGGAQRLVVTGLAPVLQDVSLRASVSAGSVTDVRAHRALRIRSTDRPEDIAALEARLHALARDLEHARDDGRRAARRLHDIARMLELGAAEVPEDAAWGLADPDQWSRLFEDLFARSRELVEARLEASFRQEDVIRQATLLERQRQALARIEQEVAVWAAVDVQLDGPAELVLEYVVPNALWRPLHRAELADGALHTTARAALWQATGEDWEDVELTLSTARASLGTEPPTLADDLLEARRKSDEVVLQAREVAVQTTGPAGPPARTIDLPGVDDGGEVQDLRPDGPVSVPADGGPVFVDLFRCSSEAEVERVCIPAVDPAVHVAVRAPHTGSRPLLAGPVELLRDHGPVGSTTTLYVAPGAPMEIGFGPDDSLRVRRDERVRDRRTDPVDGWQHEHTEVSLHLSNLAPEPAELTLTERVPVSEVEQVRIQIDSERTSVGHEPVDPNGFVRWRVSLPAHGTRTLTLDWVRSLAPGSSLS